jgi:DNA-binding Lrp family transcriptional regulator
MRETQMKTLIVQIRCKLGTAYEVAAYIVDNVREGEIYSTSGLYDLMAIFHLEDGTDPGIFINKKLHAVPNIVETNTTIAFNAFTPPKT